MFIGARKKGRVMPLIPSMNEAGKIAKRLDALYVTNRDRFVMTRKQSIFVPKRDGIPMRLCRSNLENHILQAYAVSVYSAKEGSRFVCFDIDAGGLDTVRRVVAAIRSTGISGSDIYVSSSGGKGHHVELFFDTVVPLDSFAIFYEHVMDVAQCHSAPIELRPSDKLAIKLPLSTNPKTGCMCWFLDPNSLREIESYDCIFGINPMSGAAFIELVKALPSASTSIMSERSGAVCRLPLCGENGDIGGNLPMLCHPGTRHDMMVRIAVALCYQGMSMEACAETLLDWIDQQDRRYYASSIKEVHADAWAIAKWVYQKAVITPDRQKHIVSVSPNDMRRVLGQPTRTLRKLYFFLLFSKRYSVALSQGKIARLIGSSPRNVYQNIKLLVSTGEILDLKTAAHRTNAGYFCKDASRYVVLHKPVHPELTAFWPSEVSHRSFSLPETPESFLQAYCGTVHAMFPGVDMKTHMTGSEYREYLLWAQSLGARQSSPLI